MKQIQGIKYRELKDATIRVPASGSSTHISKYESDKWQFDCGTRWSYLKRVIAPDFAHWSLGTPHSLEIELDGAYLVNSDADCEAILTAVGMNNSDYWEKVIAETAKLYFASGQEDIRVKFRTLMNVERR